MHYARFREASDILHFPVTERYQDPDEEYVHEIFMTFNILKLNVILYF